MYFLLDAACRAAEQRSGCAGHPAQSHRLNTAAAQPCTGTSTTSSGSNGSSIPHSLYPPPMWPGWRSQHGAAPPIICFSVFEHTPAALRGLRALEALTGRRPPPSTTTAEGGSSSSNSSNDGSGSRSSSGGIAQAAAAAAQGLPAGATSSDAAPQPAPPAPQSESGLSATQHAEAMPSATAAATIAAATPPPPASPAATEQPQPPPPAAAAAPAAASTPTPAPAPAPAQDAAPAAAPAPAAEATPLEALLSQPGCASRACATTKDLFRSFQSSFATTTTSPTSDAASPGVPSATPSPTGPATTTSSSSSTASTSSTTSSSSKQPFWFYEEDMPCPPDIIDLGRATWTLLHSMAAYYPQQPTPQQQQHMQDFITALGEFYPCTECRHHLVKELATHPPQVGSPEELSAWACQLHNLVNVRLGKPAFDCSRVMERWRDGPAADPDACSPGVGH